MTLWDRSGTKRLNWAKHLRNGQARDLWVMMGQTEKLSVRLVAIPLPEDTVQERRRKPNVIENDVVNSAPNILNYWDG